METIEEYEDGLGAAVCAAVPEPFFLFDEEGRYIKIIGGADKSRYHSWTHLVGKRIHDVMEKETADRFIEEIRATLAAGEPRTYVYSLAAKDIEGSGDLPGPQGKQWFEAHISPIAATEGRPRQVVWLAINITRLHTLLEEKNRLIERLESAAQEIKTLRGILPICSHCKKIRDDNGYWQQLETYLHEHSEADFSHSLCPGCVSRYYSDFT